MNKLPHNIFRGLKLKKKVRLIFSSPKDRLKDKCYLFSLCKQRNQVPFLYLERKLQQDRYR